MKVTNWRRKLMASLVAGGLLAPSAVSAADLDTNLAVDPSFENVDVGTICCYLGAATKLNSWSDGSVTGFAYNNQQPELDGDGVGWDDGGPLSGGGLYFFGAGGTDSVDNPPPITSPGEVAQNISVGTGPTGTLIATGEAVAILSGFFTSYNGQNLHGSLHVEFLNSGGTSLGSTVITADPPRPWHEERGSALIPVGTATLKASVYGDSFNAYIDLVDVRVTSVANELIVLEVNTTTGQVGIKNQTGDPIRLDYYKIDSTGGSALNATAWNSLQEQNLPGFPAGNGSGNGWEQFGGSSSSVIGESYLQGNSLVSNNTTIGLGAAFNVGGAHDLEFFYGAVQAAPAPTGDFNNNGTVDAADYVLWRNGSPLQNEGGVTPGMTTPEDYATWRANFDATGGSTGAGAIVKGFVRYVTSGASALVPEPSSVVLVGIGLGPLLFASRRKSKATDAQKCELH
jgi:hypothetical protein